MYTLTRNTLGCSKWPSNKTAGEKKAETYRYITRPALSRPRPALSHGYVDDSFEPRTKLGKGRVSARRGQGGCNVVIFSILNLAVIDELQINPKIFLFQKRYGGLEIVFTFAQYADLFSLDLPLYFEFGIPQFFADRLGFVIRDAALNR